MSKYTTKQDLNRRKSDIRRNNRNKSMATKIVHKKINVWKLVRYTCYAIMAYHLHNGVVTMTDSVIRASNQYTLETNCVKEQIAMGVPRIHIGTEDGTCWVETNAYYND